VYSAVFQLFLLKTTDFFTFSPALFTFFYEAYLGTKEPMIIVIDGYNVLKQNLKKNIVTDQEKNQFIAQLNRYGKKKNHSIITVFDGGLSPWPEVEKRGIVTIIHSGTQESADEYIMRYLDEREGKELLLISTDRTLGQHAWNLNIESIDATDFYHLLQEEIQPEVIKQSHAKQIVKLTEQENPELDALMHEASIHAKPKKEEPDPIQKKHPPKKTLSKKERRMLNKIKKL
jgi:predicted RNA-binding protein with PIN domain